MHFSIRYGGINNHLIYTFKVKKLTTLYPIESDYVATCAVDKSSKIKIDKLQLHG